MIMSLMEHALPGTKYWMVSSAHGIAMMKSKKFNNRDLNKGQVTMAMAVKKPKPKNSVKCANFRK